MRITFLGTAAGVPEKNRANSATVIEACGKLYLIDAGMPVVNRLIDFGFDLEAINATFITHAHTDHVLGLVDLIRCVNIEKIFPTAEIDYYIPENELEDSLDEYFTSVISPIRKEVNRFHLINEGVIFDDGIIRVTAVPTAHLKKANRPSYAFIVEGEGRRVVFSGDISQNIAESDIPRAVYEDEVDLFVLELAHFSLSELKPHLNGMRVKNLIFNHISDFEEKLPDIKALASENTDIKIDYSYDGYSVTLEV